MPRDPNKSKVRNKRDKQSTAPAATSWLYQSPKWPLHEALLAEAWQDERKLASMLVARQSPRSGKIAAAAFMVDLGCLGVRSAFVRTCKSVTDYERRLREPLLNDQAMLPSDLDLIAKILHEAIAYAEKLGFPPDPEARQALILLEGARPEQCTVPVVLGGPDGKPLYIPSDNDNVTQIINRLAQAVGPDGFQIRDDTGMVH